MPTNTAKILCAKGDVNDGRYCIQQSINAISDLMPMIQNYLELFSIFKIVLIKQKSLLLKNEAFIFLICESGRK